MFQEFKLDCPGGYVRYQIKNEAIHITGFGEKIFQADIPAELSGLPVKYIDKKAFMGARILKWVTLPNTIESIGDWAFASCPALESLIIQGADGHGIDMGQGVFNKDLSLQKLVLYEDSDSSYLYGAAASVMNADYLLTDHEHFLEQWDAKLLSILGEADDEGFVFMVLCGEEDLTADIDEYKEMRRKRKAYLSFLRLIYDRGLDADFRVRLENYLKERTCGCKSDAAFKVILDNNENDSFVSKFFELNLVNDDNLSLVLESLGDRYASFKARILSGHSVKKDFFASLMV